MLREAIEMARRDARFAKVFGRIVLQIRPYKAGEERTILDPIERWADLRPHNIALIDAHARMTYRQMDERANRYARWARRQGVRRGDVVGLMMANRVEYLCAWLGVLKAGAVCALYNTHLRGAPLAHVVRVSGAEHAIVGAELLGTWRSGAAELDDPPNAWAQVPPGVDAEPSRSRGASPPSSSPRTSEKPRIALRANDFASFPQEVGGDVRSLDEALDAESPVRLPQHVRRGLTAEKAAFYVYTSGTTGLPKAAKITHIRAASMMHAFATAFEAGERDRVYVPLPLYHATGGICGVGAALTVGGALVVREKFSASHFWSDVVEHDCTLFMYVGELCRYLVASPPHPDERRHRVRACSGNGLRPEVWPELRDRFGIPHIIEFYGSSEGNVSLFNLDDEVGAVGRLPKPATLILNVKIVRFDVEREAIVRDAKGRVIECAPGEVGEAIGLIDPDKPGGRFDGYRDEAATKKKILEDAFTKGDRWFRTGDLLRKDERGYFYFVDRIGDTFRWKGENVATSEVAEVLAVFDGVTEANVYGVKVGALDGRAGMAALVMEDDLDLEALYAHLGRNLPSYARPLLLRRLEAMDTTGTFKHRKVDLVREGFDPATVSDRLWLRDDAEQTFVPLDEALHAAVIAGERRV